MRGGSIALVLATVAAAAGCSGTGAPRRPQPTDLVTRTSLGGIHLQDSRATVERLYGHGRNLGRHGARAFHYRAGLTVYYDTEGKGPRVAVVEATSSRFHTASGARLGSSLRAVKALGHMDCSRVTGARTECLTRAYGPGLLFDLAGGKVVRLALVLRTN